MLTKCVKCKFNVRQNDEFCANCGLQNPTQKNVKLKKQKLNKPLFFSLITIFYVIFFMLFWLLTPNPYLSLSTFISTSLTTLLFSSISGFFFHNFILIKLYENSRKKRKVYNNENLLQKENLVLKRIADLNQRNSRLTTLLSKIGNSQTQNLQEIKQKLISAQEIINNQFVRYELQKKKIELVRLQNKILPYLENLERLKDFQAENGIIETESVMNEIAEIAQNLSKKVPSSFQTEQQSFLQQLQETSISCETLREVLLSKQALRALQSVQPIEDIDSLPQTKDLCHAIETFNIQTTLTDFSESFEQLETEYRRLLADNEVSEKLLNYEN